MLLSTVAIVQHSLVFKMSRQRTNYLSPKKLQGYVNHSFRRSHNVLMVVWCCETSLLHKELGDNGEMLVVLFVVRNSLLCHMSRRKVSTTLSTLQEYNSTDPTIVRRLGLLLRFEASFLTHRSVHIKSLYRSGALELMLLPIYFYQVLKTRLAS